MKKFHPSQPASFAQLGEVFDDATTRMVGGINDANRGIILDDLTRVQDGLTKLLAAQPESFTGTAGIHAQNIIDQLNLEKQAIANVGTDPFAAKYINDVQRDLIDIVQGDDRLVALATQNGHDGFAAVPDLLVPPAPFVGSAEQTEFMKGFITTTQDFADRAIQLADSGGSQADIEKLVGEVQAYNEQANAFTMAQGGLYSARFDNEFAGNGVNGTASRALIDGLQSGNADKVHAAAEVLVANAGDVASNMLPNGSAPVATGNGIPDQITTLAQAGTVFNDATAKLVGGVYSGNQQSIHDDLTAARQGMLDMLDAGAFTGNDKAAATRIANLLAKEVALVDTADPVNGASPQLNQLHAKVIGIVQGDADLAAAATADGASGFMTLPSTLGGNCAVAQGAGQGPIAGMGSSSSAGGQGHGFGVAANDPTADPLGHVFGGHGHGPFHHA